MEDERWLIMGVLDHLQKATTREEVQNKDSIWEAIFALSVAYGLNIRNTATRERYPLNGHSMVDIFKAGLEQLSGDKGQPSNPLPDSSNPTKDAMEVEKLSPTTGSTDPVFAKFLKVLRETTTFFNGVEEGSPEYDNRVKQAKAKYDARLAAKQQNGQIATERSPEASTDAKENAEALKVEGNVQLKAKDYKRALELYTKAIELDGTNAVFYSNRAAANLLLRRFTEAVDDCKRAINLDPEFLRPRERLAAAYRQLGMSKKESDTLKEALKIAPGNEDIQRRLTEAESRLAGGASASGAPASGAPGAPGVPGAPPGLETLLSRMPNDPSQINDMARSLGFNFPEGAVDSFLSSGGVERVASMLRENPNVMQETMQSMSEGGFPGFPGMLPGGFPGGFPGGPPPGTDEGQG